LTSMPRSSYLWSNWCGPAAGMIRAVVTAQGHVVTTTTSERPMCLYPHRPISFTWGVKPLPNYGPGRLSRRIVAVTEPSVY
jgi:hypothetical protein